MQTTFTLIMLARQHEFRGLSDTERRRGRVGVAQREGQRPRANQPLRGQPNAGTIVAASEGLAPHTAPSLTTPPTSAAIAHARNGPVGENRGREMRSSHPRLMLLAKDI